MLHIKISPRLFVEEWWLERLEAGTQLSGGAEALTDELRGPGPWFRTVSIGALYEDYRAAVVKRHSRAYDLVSRTGFAMILRSLLPRDTETIYARINTPDGQVRKRCIRFKDLKAYLRAIAA